MVQDDFHPLTYVILNFRWFQLLNYGLWKRLYLCYHQLYNHANHTAQLLTNYMFQNLTHLIASK